ncbi:MAG: hypothetical protein ACREK1_12855 [Longimicrobiales bacterium]
MTVLRTVGLVLATSTVLAACGTEQEQTRSDADPVESGAEPNDGMEGMEGMGTMQDGMMDEMMAQMQMMDGAGADSVQAMMPMHRQMAANMLARMNREMRDMNMTADAAWSATVDSLRQDLTRMPELTGSELEAMMPGHHARMMRLMEMHRTMMSEMQM